MGFKLNDRQILGLVKKGKPCKKPVGCGLYFRITNEKKYSWIYRYTMNDKRPEMTIGHYPEMSLAEATSEVLKKNENVRKGIYPLVEKQREASNPFKTVDDLAEEWLKEKAERVKHPQIPRRIYRKEIQPFLGNIPLNQVNPRDIKSVLKRIAVSGRPSISNDALHLCKEMFRYGIKLDVIDRNPADAFDVYDAGGEEKSRKRNLEREEIHHVFEVFQINNKQITREIYLFVALSLLLSIRKCELLNAIWKEFNFNKSTWTIPEERTKTKAAITIPLSNLALEIFKELQMRSCGSEFVFPAKKSGTKTGHMSESTPNAAIKKLFEQEKLKIAHFTVHDLRRTSRTLLGKLKVPQHIAERCLNHKMKKGDGTYDLYDYFEERKEAQQKLADLLAPIVMPTK